MVFSFNGEPGWSGTSAAEGFPDPELGRGADGEYIDYDSFDAAWETAFDSIDDHLAAREMEELERAWNPPTEGDDDWDEEDALEAIESREDLEEHEKALCIWCGDELDRYASYRVSPTVNGRFACGAACRSRPGLSESHRNRLLEFTIG